MIDEINKIHVMDHVEIIDTIPNTDSGNLDTEDKVSSMADSNTISIEDISKLFKGRNLSYVSTLSSDGSPHVTPVWSDIDEENNILINISEISAKKKHVDKDPRIAIAIVEQYNPYNMVSIKGRVIDQTSIGRR